MAILYPSIPDVAWIPLILVGMRLTHFYGGVLATYHIRLLNQAFKSTFRSLLQLADSPEEE